MNTTAIYAELSQNNIDIQKLSQLLQNDKRVQDLEKSKIPQGFQCTDFTIDKLVYCLISKTKKVGAQQTIDELEAYLSMDKVKVRSAVWVSGLKPNKSFDIAKNFRFSTIEDMPDCNLKRVSLSYGQNAMYNVPDSALFIEYELPKQIAHNDEKLIKEVNLKLLSMLPFVTFSAMTFGLMHGCKPEIIAQKNYIIEPIQNEMFADMEIMYLPVSRIPFVGMIFDRTILEITSENKIVEIVRNILKHIDSKDLQNKILILRRLLSSKETKDLGDRVIDLSIALEMLLLNDNIKDELNYRLRERGAVVLGQDRDERLNIFKVLGDLYDARSKVMHTGMMGKKPKISLETLDECIGYTEKLCKLIFINGFFDWKDLMIAQRTVNAPTI